MYDGEEDAGSGVRALSPSGTTKCWQELARGGRDGPVSLQIGPANKEILRSIFILCSCASTVLLPMEKENRLQLGVPWERGTVAWDIPVEHSAGRACKIRVAFLQSGLVAVGLFLC